MCVLDMSTNTFVAANPPTQAVGVTYYSFVNDAVRNTMLLYGGIGPNNVANPNLIGTPVVAAGAAPGTWNVQVSIPLSC